MEHEQLISDVKNLLVTKEYLLTLEPSRVLYVLEEPRSRFDVFLHGALATSRLRLDVAVQVKSTPCNVVFILFPDQHGEGVFWGF